jgi:predicted nucleic acid-binding protein
MIAPLAQDAIAALLAMRAAFPSQPLALIGATALGCHIPMKWRRTEDLDLVVALSIEDASRALAALPGWSQNDRKEHEWRSPRGVLVDLLPVSTQALAARVLLWPRTGHAMSLVGIRHALSSPAISITEGLALAVPSVAIIRTLDALHLATAHHLAAARQRLTIATFDDRMRRAAVALGLTPAF